MLCFYASKGGVGCSVAAAATAVLAARERDTVLVDLAGDQCDLLGLPDDGPGLGEWLAAPAALPDTLVRLEMRVSDRLSLLPLGRRGSQTGTPGCGPGVVEPERLAMLGSLLGDDGRRVIVDVGRVVDGRSASFLAAADRTVLVIRPCYLALRAAADVPSPDDVVLVSEPGRALRTRDVEAALDAPSLVVVAHDLDVARRVDAGLLVNRLPRSMQPLGALL